MGRSWATCEVFATGVDNPEGPVYLGDGSWVITEMNRGVVTRIGANGTSRRILAVTGRPNGLAADEDGVLWVAESKFPALLRLRRSGRVTVVADQYEDSPFLWPNDLCFGPDGALYLTDSGVALSAVQGADPPESVYDAAIDGRLFRIDPHTGAVELLDRGLRFANGIAWGPGGTALYVAETMTGNIYRYEADAGLRRDGRRVFANVMRERPRSYGRIAGPDGMAFDQEGNLYVTVVRQGDIAVVRPDGSIREYIELPGEFPTNVAFAGSADPRILVTEGSLGQLLMLGVSVPGLPLHTATAGWTGRT